MSLLSSHIEKCPICAQNTYAPFFELNDVPTQDGVLWDSMESALRAPKGNIKLAFCQECGYIGNLIFDPNMIKYDLDYSFSLHYSPTYREFAHRLASRLVENYNLINKTILEIGCGQGDFLRLLCELGNNDGIGIDPSIISKVEQLSSSQINFLREIYSERYADLFSDLICCRQVLDQLADPRKFVDMVRRNIGNRQETVIYFEVPNAANIFEDMLIRNIIYEKCSWFTIDSLSNLFELAGFKVCSVKPCFEDGQYVGIEAVARSSDISDRHFGGRVPEHFKQSIKDFGENYWQKIKRWDNQLSLIQQGGQRAIVWGAGSGAINFFCLLNVKDSIPYVVDINPKRQGRFLPLTGQQVVSPEYVSEYGADIIIITNSTYEKEIKQEVASMGMNCSFWTI